MTSEESAEARRLLMAYYGCDKPAMDQLAELVRPFLASALFRRWRSGELPRPSKQPATLEEAEYLCFDTILRVMETKTRATWRFDPATGAIGPWLVTLMKNLWFDECRKGDMRLQSEGTDPPEPPVVDEDALAAQASEFLTALRECCAQLPDQDALIERRFGEKPKDQKDIARELGVSPSTLTRRFQNEIYAPLIDCLQAKGHEPEIKRIKDALEAMSHD
jgi:RNA polymerase sigma factor (sigma-70 family)